MSSGMYGNAVTISHQTIVKVVNSGDIVVDATCGRGNDTLFLARLVGAGGKVYAFDIQEEAIISTKTRLEKEKLAAQVVLINDSHSRMAEYIEVNIKACMFNLGYLPKGNQQIKTEAASTLKALKSAMRLLAEGGIITIVSYPGHKGGEQERQEIFSYLQMVPQSEFEIIETRFINQINHPPQLFTIQKLTGGIYES